MPRLRPASLVLVLLACAGDSPDGREGETAISSHCDPNYTGACVPRYPPDVDCPDIGRPVRVADADPHGLDGDGDGLGCESS